MKALRRLGSLLLRALVLPVPSAVLRRWTQPSLARRTLLVALSSFAVVWVVLVARDVQKLSDHGRHLNDLQRAARIMVGALGERPEAEALLIVQTSEQQYNALRRLGDHPPGLGDLQFQLERVSDGAVIYASRDLSGQHLSVPVEQPALRTFQDHSQWMAASATPRWRITIMAPTLNHPKLPLWLAGQLLEPLLISFPLVFIPLWLAVRQGLRPLRDLSERMRQRAPDDFSPLGLHLPQAELQPLEQSLEHLLARARDGITRERAFVQDAAHELRTPLAVMTAQAHALAAAPDDTARQTSRTALESAVQRASHLVHQLMTLARLEGPAPPAVQAVDLVALTRQVVIAAAPEADRRCIEITLDSPDHLDLQLDTVAFHSVLDNLLRNALAYGHEGGRVAVTLKQEGDHLRLAVADDGPGIAEADRARLFDRFHRGATAMDHSGAGLGLAIVKQAAHRIGGRLTIGPGLDARGTSFELIW